MKTNPETVSQKNLHFSCVLQWAVQGKMGELNYHSLFLNISLFCAVSFAVN